MTASTGLAAALRARGVTRVFGIPGSQTTEFVDALRGEGIEFMLASHEGGAAFMAIGAARATGRFSVLSTIAGPGFTNALTGLVEARHDSVPVLHIVNAPSRDEKRSFLLQAIEHDALTRNVVHAVVRLTPTGSAQHALDEAVEHMTSGEPGPVLLEVGPGPAADADRASTTGGSGAGDAADDASWARLQELWRAASRPMFYVGYGVADDRASLRAIAERYRVPVMTTPSGRGAIPEGHELALSFDPLKGRLGLANEVLSESDLVIAVGCKFTHNGSAGFGLRLEPDRLVHVDRSSAVLGANYPAAVQIRASASELFSVLDRAERDAPAEWDPSRVEAAASALAMPEPSAQEPKVAGRPAADFFALLRDAIPDGGVLVTDSGQHQIMTRRHYPVRDAGELLFPGDYQSMGFAIPVAIGHRLSDPSRPVVALLGDGGLLMSGMELPNAARERIRLPVIVFNDGYLGQIRLQQLRDSGHAEGVTTGLLSLDAFAAAVGAEYVPFDWASPPDLSAILGQSDGTTLIEVPVGDASGLALRSGVQRAKGMMRDALGDDMVDRLKGLLGRGSS